MPENIAARQIRGKDRLAFSARPGNSRLEKTGLPAVGVRQGFPGTIALSLEHWELVDGPTLR
jgi:hypothetical protein